MLERSLVRYIIQQVRKAGGLAFKIVGNPYQPTGLPDLLVFSDAGVCGVEAKVARSATAPAQPFNLLTARQKAMCNILHRYIPIYIVVRSANAIHVYAYPSADDIGLARFLGGLKGGK